MTATETPEAALARIRSGFSKNDAAVILAFASRGIDPEDITPRENVLTYKAWQAIGRQVRKGEKGERLTTWINTEKKNPKTGKTEDSKYPRTVSVFHISQTDPT